MQVLNLLVGIAFHSYVCVKALRQVDKLIMSKQSIRRKNLVVGLNPALQRVIDFNKLEVGSVNRGSNVQVGIGGKGQNAYISSLCTSLSQPSSLLQFVGSGGEGDTLIKLLHQLGSNISDINDFSIRTVSSCRTCITLIDKSTEEVTELIEPSGAIEPSEIEEMFSKLSSSFDHRNKVGGIAVMGSSPPGCPSSLYSDIIRLVCDNQSKVLLDTVISIFETIRLCYYEIGCQVMLKVNAQELCKLNNAPYEKESTGSVNVNSIKSALNGIRSVIASLMSESNQNDKDFNGMKIFVAVTDGPHASFFSSVMDEKLWKLSLIAKPSFPIVNPIGAGDAVASGTMHCWADALQQKSQLHTFNPVFSSLTNDKLIEDSITSFGWGLACGTSSCATNTNSVFDVQTAVQLFQNFTVEELI